MSFLQELAAKAAGHPMRVAFPEAENEKMMHAAYECVQEGCIKAILVGDSEKNRTLAAERGLDPEKFIYADMQDEEMKARSAFLSAQPEGADVSVKTLTAYPEVLVHSELTKDPSSDGNRLLARFYHLGKIWIE